MHPTPYPSTDGVQQVPCIIMGLLKQATATGGTCGPPSGPVAMHDLVATDCLLRAVTQAGSDMQELLKERDREHVSHLQPHRHLLPQDQLLMPVPLTSVQGLHTCTHTLTNIGIDQETKLCAAPIDKSRTTHTRTHTQVCIHKAESGMGMPPMPPVPVLSCPYTSATHM